MNVDAKGFAELDRKLAQLPAEIAFGPLSDAVQAGAKFIEDEARRRAPRDKGDLAKSIGTQMGRRGRSGDPEAKIGPNRREQKVGRFQEFGTAHNAAQPFLRPALDSRAQTALDVMRKSLAIALDKLGIR
jgi:HK97 gp10 family phage protein